MFLTISVTLFFHNVKGYEFDSTGTNRVDTSPLYDAIIFSDIADIINEFDNNTNSALQVDMDSKESESDEDIEDLLSEYQHYLDKAHNQRMNYFEKTNLKKRAQFLQNEMYNDKKKPTFGYNLFDPVPMKQPFTSIRNVLDYFLPAYHKPKNLDDHISIIQLEPKYYREDSSNKLTLDEKNGLHFVRTSAPLLISKSFDPNCVCKNMRGFCDCNCKRCFPNSRGLYSDKTKTQNSLTKNRQTDTSQEMNDNTFNLRIKLDIQIPKNQADKHITSYKLIDNNNTQTTESVSRAINFQFPLLNIPIPLEWFGENKTQKKEQQAITLPKITMQKKKSRSKSLSNNKKHKRKYITFHNIKLVPENIINFDVKDKIFDKNSITDVEHEILLETQGKYTNNTVPNKSENSFKNNETHTVESVHTKNNITNTKSNVTDDIPKIENSIEVDDFKNNSYLTTEKQLLRLKRDTIKDSEKNKKLNKSKIIHVHKLLKADKALLVDKELLSWSDNEANTTAMNAKNVTEIILEREKFKGKLNITNDMIRHNRSKALEQVIFGEVTWNDIDTVASMFISIAGKYLRGVMTFCTENTCRSMKCEDKVCIERSCTPKERMNQRGHCNSAKNTDRVVSMESIMDLPSNAVFEIVDILEDRMRGKMFGKITLCVNLKCLTFIANKKTIVKTKCSIKGLDTMGHCVNITKFM